MILLLSLITNQLMMTSPNLCLGWNDLLCCFNIQHPTVLISTAAGGNCFARVEQLITSLQRRKLYISMSGELPTLVVMYGGTLSFQSWISPRLRRRDGKLTQHPTGLTFPKHLRVWGNLSSATASKDALETASANVPRFHASNFASAKETVIGIRTVCDKYFV